MTTSRPSLQSVERVRAFGRYRRHRLDRHRRRRRRLETALTTRTAPTQATRTTPTLRKAAEAALARCLEPVDAGMFFAEHWAKRPLLVERDEPGRFDDLLSEADVERLVCSTGIRYPAFRLVQRGKPTGRRRVHERGLRGVRRSRARRTCRACVAEWEAGATIVLQAMHVNWHPLAVFCRLLEEAIGRPVQANAYYTPRGSQGFAVHHDTHDVLVLQIAGEKRWLLYEPLLELPLKHQRYSAALGEHGEPTDDFVLSAGGSLYLPRGWLHQAKTSETDSLHLTIGIAQHTWLDAARGALEASRTSSRSVTASRTALRTASPTLVAEQLDPELVERRRRRQFVDSRRPIREDGLSQLRALERLDARDAARAPRDGDRRPRRIAGAASCSSSRASRSGSRARRAPRCGRASRADEPFRRRRPSRRARRRRAGSCSRAASSARASSGSGADDAQCAVTA